MKTTVGTVLSLILCAAGASAQDPPASAPQAPQAATAAAAASGKDYGYGWFLSLGGGAVDWGDINNAFNGAGYEDLAGGLWTFGGGGYGTVGRLLIGGEFYSLEGTEVSSSGGRETRAAGGIGQFNLGYMLVSTETHRLYPLLGLGGQWIGIRVLRSTGTGLGPDLNNPPFNQVLQDPGLRSQLARTGFAVSLGAGAEFTGLRKTRPNGFYGLLIGIRAGYTFVPARSDWYLYDVPVIGGPDDIGQGFFVRVTLGGAGARHPRSRAACPMHHDGGACPMGQACPMHQGHQGAAACRHC